MPKIEKERLLKIIGNLKKITGNKTDRSLSQWFGKKDNYIQICRKRQTIDMTTIISKFKENGWDYNLIESDATDTDLEAPQPETDITVNPLPGGDRVMQLTIENAMLKGKVDALTHEVDRLIDIVVSLRK